MTKYLYVESLIGLLVIALTTAPVPAQPSTTRPAPRVADTIGWRQNWTGLFPQATPPATWGRTLKDSIVKGLRSQCAKPQGDEPTDAAKPMADGLLLNYLAIGLFDPKDAAKALDEPLLEGEDKVQPDEGQAVGDRQWKVLTWDRAVYPLNDQAPAPLYKSLPKPKPGQVGYLHSYLYSQRSGKVDLMLDHTGGCKAWLNGREIYSQPKFSIGFGWWGPMSAGKLNFRDPPRSARVQVELKRGWNSVLLKVVAMEMEWGRGFAVLPRFIDVGPVAYEDKNILWAAPLGDTSNANPIVVGERVFALAEHDELICLDKKTGKQLWNRFNSHLEATPKADIEKSQPLKEAWTFQEQLHGEFDKTKRYAIQRQIRSLLDQADWNYALDFYKAMTPDQHAKAPEVKEKVEPLLEKLKTAAKDARGPILAQICRELKPAGFLPRFEIKMESHPEGHWFSTGFTTPAPCSDGRFVYLWMTHGVAACYDLDGNRRWIKRIDELVKNPDDKDGPYFYPQGCVLSGGKFIFWDKETFALDAATGEIAWRQPKLALGLGATPAVIDGTDVVVTANDVIRTSDGKVLWASKERGYVSNGGGTFRDGLLCVPRGSGPMTIFDFVGVSGEPYKPTRVGAGLFTEDQNRQSGDDYNPKGAWKDQWLFAAPLIHDGLAYVVDAFAMLYVADVKTGGIAYRKQLPLAPLVNVRSVAITAAPALGGRNIYAFDNQGGCVVFEPGPQYKQVALNRIETWMPRTHTGEGWQELSTYGSPVIDGGRIYVRGEAYLYCIGG
ncbi:MAG: PQQ-binding-like beta-propeller repeat protein [Phycisphaerae bacterium]